MITHAQKPDFVFRRNGRAHLNRRGLQFSRLLAAEACASVVVMLDTSCSEVVWRVLATYSIRQFPHHFPSRASPCAITFQLDSTYHQQLLNIRWQFKLIAYGYEPPVTDANKPNKQIYQKYSATILMALSLLALPLMVPGSDFTAALLHGKKMLVVAFHRFGFTFYGISLYIVTRNLLFY